MDTYNTYFARAERQAKKKSRLQNVSAYTRGTEPHRMITLTNHDENSLESWDRRYNVFFGFPKVFTALSEIDDDVIRKDVREELIYALQEVWRQLDSELGETEHTFTE